MMPESWTPGQNIRMPDPTDPTKFIEIPADAVEVVAEVAPVEASRNGSNFGNSH